MRLDPSLQRDVRLVVAPPAACSDADLERFRDLVRDGGQVADKGLVERVRRAALLAIVWVGDELAAVGAVKQPHDDYRDDVFAKAGVPQLAPGYRLEAGWFFTRPRLRDRGLVALAVPGLVARVGHLPVFATTRSTNAPARHLLERHGFRVAGQPWATRDGGGDLLLHVRAAAG
jgi:hypothetical protein